MKKANDVHRCGLIYSFEEFNTHEIAQMHKQPNTQTHTHTRAHNPMKVASQNTDHLNLARSDSPKMIFRFSWSPRRFSGKHKNFTRPLLCLDDINHGCTQFHGSVLDVERFQPCCCSEWQWQWSIETTTGEGYYGSSRRRLLHRSYINNGVRGVH